MFKAICGIGNNFLYKRVCSIRRSILAYSLASFIDIFTILFISSIFNKITASDSQSDIYFNIFQCIFFIIFRTFFVFFLRKYSFNNVFNKKTKDEKYLVNNFVTNRTERFINENNDISMFKERLINSCNLAAINFDIPIVAIFAEVIFALGGILILLNIFGIRLFIFNFPIFIILVFFSKFVSVKLNILGKRILDFTEKRLNSIDNISELAIECASLRNNKNLINYFEKINKPYNYVLSQQIITSNMMQIYTESASFLIILFSLIFIITNLTNTTFANSATSLAVLSRMVPSFTRCISFVTQLQFGIPCVKRLSHIKNL